MFRCLEKRKIRCSNFQSLPFFNKSGGAWPKRFLCLQAVYLWNLETLGRHCDMIQLDAGICCQLKLVAETWNLGCNCRYSFDFCVFFVIFVQIRSHGIHHQYWTHHQFEGLVTMFVKCFFQPPNIRKSKFNKWCKMHGRRHLRRTFCGQWRHPYCADLKRRKPSSRPEVTGNFHLSRPGGCRDTVAPWFFEQHLEFHPYFGWKFPRLTYIFCRWVV